MATYGRGQMLGAGIDPRMFVQDYSGFARAGAIQGQGMAQLGADIGDIGKQFGEFKKEQTENEKKINKIVKVADSISELLPENMRGSVRQYAEGLSDLNRPQSDRLADAAAIEQILELGIQAKQSQDQMAFQREKFEFTKQQEADRISALSSQQPKKQIMQVGQGVYSVDPQSGTASPVIVEEQKMPEPLSGFSDAFSKYGQQYGVDPNLLAAIAIHETGGGTSSAFRNKNNLMGVSNAKGPIAFDNPEESIERMARLIGQGINENKGPYAGVTDIESLANIYAPVGAGNDPRGLNQYWANSVNGIYESLQMGGGQGRQLTVPQETKPTARFRVAKPEEAASFGAVAGQIDESTGRFYPINPPPGMSVRTTPEGGVEFVQGPGVGQTPKEKKAEQAKKVSVDQNMMDLYFLEDRTKDMAEGVTGAAGRIVAEKIPATQQAENKAVIDRISSRLTLGSLQAIREASPTGGSLGNVSDKDIQILKDSATSLRNAQSPAEFQRELIRLQNLQYETIYGDKNFVKKELKEGRITQQEFDFIELNRPQNFLDSRGQIRIRTTREQTQRPVTGLTEDEQKLLDKYPE
jgi:flagellum-specific peptidoglycan hydrolase FlgJ